MRGTKQFGFLFINRVKRPRLFTSHFKGLGFEFPCPVSFMTWRCIKNLLLHLPSLVQALTVSIIDLFRWYSNFLKSKKSLIGRDSNLQPTGCVRDCGLNWRLLMRITIRKIFGLHPKAQFPQPIYAFIFVVIMLVGPTKVSTMKLKCTVLNRMWQHDFIMKQIFFSSIFSSKNTGPVAKQAGYSNHDPWHTRYKILCFIPIIKNQLFLPFVSWIAFSIIQEKRPPTWEREIFFSFDRLWQKWSTQLLLFSIPNVGVLWFWGHS